MKSITTIDTPTTNTITPSKLCSGLDDLYQVNSDNTTFFSVQTPYVIPTYNKESAETAKLNERLKELKCERIALDKQRSSSGVQRNLVFPIIMLLLVLLTSITVALVAQNAIELLIGIKALPLSSRVRNWINNFVINLINDLYSLNFSNSRLVFHHSPS